MVLLVALQSCGTIITPINFERRNYDNVPLDKILINEIGETLITKGQEDYQKAYEISKIPEFKINLVEFPYKEGDILPLMGENNNYLLYYDPYNTATNYDEIGFAENKKTGEIKPFISSAAGFYPKGVPGIEVKESTYVDPKCNDCFKQEFVFNGKANNVLKFMYREYVNDMARPAFTQELQYDLTEGNTIGFKGLRIEVIDASNTSITYKVLNSFN